MKYLSRLYFVFCRRGKFANNSKTSWWMCFFSVILSVLQSETQCKFLRSHILTIQLLTNSIQKLQSWILPITSSMLLVERSAISWARSVLSFKISCFLYVLSYWFWHSLKGEMICCTSDSCYIFMKPSCLTNLTKIMRLFVFSTLNNNAWFNVIAW